MKFTRIAASIALGGALTVSLCAIPAQADDNRDRGVNGTRVTSVPSDREYSVNGTRVTSDREYGSNGTRVTGAGG